MPKSVGGGQWKPQIVRVFRADSGSFGTMPSPSRLRRSVLATPATNPNMIAKAADSQADVAFLDLEDAVVPAERRQARHNIVDAFNDLNWGRTARAFRINPVSTYWCHDDLIEVVGGAGGNVDVVIVPKAHGPRDVWFVDDLLTQLERKHDLEPGRIGLEVLIEEASALAQVDAICASSPRLEAVTLGIGDLAASLGMRLGHIGVTDSGRAADYDGDIWHYARSQLILAARSHGVSAIDGPYADFSSRDGFRQAADRFATMGGSGKWCIHPSQIGIANEVFAPTPSEIAEAQAVIDAMDSAKAQGYGAANLDGTMIDAASVRAFQVTLDRARQCGLL